MHVDVDELVRMMNVNNKAENVEQTPFCFDNDIL